MLHPDIAAIRINYSQQSLTEEQTAAHPVNQFTTWWKDAVSSQLSEVNAMTLATADEEGWPDARIVLLKDYSHEGFVFFTNYNSAKGKILARNPKASLVLFWKELERQIRITGHVEKIAPSESDLYFYSRPSGSQIGAIISPQSSVIPNSDWLTQQYEQKAAENILERPAHWGGYIVKPVKIEFWQGRPSRLHDRIRYHFSNNEWIKERLAP